ncbi:hypothetical protein SAMN02745133_01581 [Desulforamulus putei DSM 12395]|uniref:Uncharacterized protein n=1 Tax=Desulforamulus putei DSM 12395 TaxID=1121429 RepID=A0A1M4XYT5_9FIRM|nr:hypothetical protein [Desulforamulus putei]SHE98727.1 hypothetical protein SAMN02745133_01581 [Desulforamulus putei DSM 12395]
MPRIPRLKENIVPTMSSNGAMNEKISSWMIGTSRGFLIHWPE